MTAAAAEGVSGVTVAAAAATVVVGAVAETAVAVVETAVVVTAASLATVSGGTIVRLKAAGVRPKAAAADGVGEGCARRVPRCHGDQVARSIDCDKRVVINGQHIGVY